MQVLVLDSRLVWLFAVSQSAPERTRNGIIAILLGIGCIWLTFRSKFFRDNRGKVAEAYLGENKLAALFTWLATAGMRIASVLFVVAGVLAVAGVL
jgi:hypothetical protein